jgi:hypothetical protein
MKTAKINRGSGRFLLDNIDSRISIAHNKISSYRQQGIEIAVIKAVAEEFTERKAREIIDGKCQSLKYSQRMHIINQVLEKRSEILQKFGQYTPAEKVEMSLLQNEVSAFYSSAENRPVLEEIMKRKQSRHLMPSPNDIKLLAGCCAAKRDGFARVILLSDDSHFTGFSPKIMEKFGVEIEGL